MSKLAIDVPLIENIIRELKKDATARVIDVNFKTVGAKGDNYTSDVNQILIKCRLKKDGKEVDAELSLFVKTMHTSDDKSLTALLRDMYDNETTVMAGPLKRMNDILGIPQTSHLLYSHSEEPYFAIMEDLIPLGFSMASRMIGLDLPHASLAIRNLAKFHASSIAVYEETPEYKIKFRKSLFNNLDDGTTEFLVNGMIALGTEISDWEELGPKYGEKLKNLAKVVFSRTQIAFAPREDEFTVLTHGDCSQLNMLFAYDEKKKPNKVALVDFQYTCYSCPGVDLRYFLSCSITQDVYQHHQYSLLEEYQSVLSETMKNLNCRTPVPSLEDIKKMYNDRIFVSVICTCLIEPIMHAKASKVVPMDSMLSDDIEEARKRYQEADFRKMLIARLPDYDKLGLLDL